MAELEEIFDELSKAVDLPPNTDFPRKSLLAMDSDKDVPIWVGEAIHDQLCVNADILRAILNELKTQRVHK